MVRSLPRDKLCFVITLSFLLISSNHSKLVPNGSYVRPKYKVCPKWVNTQKTTSQISYNPLSDTGVSVLTHHVHSLEIVTMGSTKDQKRVTLLEVKGTPKNVNPQQINFNVVKHLIKCWHKNHVKWVCGP
jgi:hypothetical protein